VAAAVACGAPTEVPSATSERTDATTALVGDWAWGRSCDAFVRVFRDARLAELTAGWLVEARYFPREDLIDPRHPCRGAKETRHVYFFESSGRWGSIDEDGVLVDDREFAVVDEDTIAFDAIEVDFAIDREGRVAFTVRSPTGCDAACEDTYAWAVATFGSAILRPV
jgi:hypothetical protein